MAWSPTGLVADPFAGATRYQVVYADPPWSYRDQAVAGRRGASFKYPLLSNRDIAALPVERITAEDALLFLWVTWPKLPEVLPVIDAWGFRYRTVAFVWVKRTRASGALAWGMGNWTRANTEPCLLASRGKPKRVSAGVHQVVEAQLARHSEKPGEVQERIVQLAGDISRIELFARQVTPGWDAWGADLHADSLYEPSEAAPEGAGARPAAATGSPPPTPGATDADPPRRGSLAWQATRGRILEHVRAHGPATRRELAAGLEVGAQPLKSLLAGLVRDGVLTRRGRTRATRYALAEGQRQAGGASPDEGQLALRPREL